MLSKNTHPGQLNLGKEKMGGRGLEKGEKGTRNGVKGRREGGKGEKMKKREKEEDGERKNEQ